MGILLLGTSSTTGEDKYEHLLNVSHNIIVNLLSYYWTKIFCEPGHWEVVINILYNLKDIKQNNN